MAIYGKWASFASLMGLAAFGRIEAQTLAPATFKYGTCADVNATNFTKVSILNTTKVPDLSEPTRFSVAKDGRVFFSERNGNVRVIKTDGTIVKIGQVPVFLPSSPLKKSGNNEFGLDGLILDRNFETTGWIYLYYQPPTTDVSKLSRFKVNGTTMDLASEQNILTWPVQKDYCCHTGGSMQFDNKGDLWFSIGNNTHNPNDAFSATGYVDANDSVGDDGAHSANTNDLRGKILHIHPTDAAGTDGKFYTVPAGNLKEYYASMWSAADLAKVRPEIYVMGNRSNWSITYDTLKNVLTWGDIGPDEGYETEEFNITAKPGYFGFPYFCGAEGNPHYIYRLNKDPKAPTNTSKWNSGVVNLPPAIGATIGYLKSAAITGPIYHWSAGQTSAKKLPPHFDGKWFIGDFDAGYIHAVTLDDAATSLVDRKGFVNGLNHLIQITIGPDGMLYTLEYAVNYFATDGYTQIKRWEYTGAACEATSSVLDQAKAHGDAGKLSMLLNLGFAGQRIVSMPEGAAGFRLYDLQGKLAWQYQASDKAINKIAVPAALGNGVYRVKFAY